MEVGNLEKSSNCNKESHPFSPHLFQVVEVLDQKMSEENYIVLLCNYKEQQNKEEQEQQQQQQNEKSITNEGKKKGIFILKKQPFDDHIESMQQLLSNVTVDEPPLIQNDKYLSVIGKVPSIWQPLILSSIFPASEMDIQKLRKAEMVKYVETKQIYHNISKKYIEKKIAQGTVKWIENIVVHRTAEQDRIIFESKGEFILIPNIDWDGKSLSNIHCIALVCDGDSIRSLRDLNQNHIQLLKSIRDKGTKALIEMYGNQLDGGNLTEDQIELSVHYHPSFYWFHVHFSNLYHPCIDPGRSHFLDDIISNIERDAQFYGQKDMRLYLKKGSELHGELNGK